MRGWQASVVDVLQPFSHPTTQPADSQCPNLGESKTEEKDHPLPSRPVSSAKMTVTIFIVALCALGASPTNGDNTAVTGTYWASENTHANLQLTGDLKAVQDLLDRKIWSSERHDRVVQMLVDQYHDRSSARDRRQTTECTCTNIPSKIECSNVEKGGVLGESYAANMLAGLTWVGIIAIGAGIGYWAGLGSKIKEFKGAADADGDGKISLEEMLGYASAKAAPILGDGGAVTQAMNIVQDAGNMDADGDGHVSAKEALAFASRLKDEAAPLLEKARNGMVNPEAEAAVGTLDSMLSLATNTMSAHNINPDEIAAGIDKAAEGAGMISAAKKAIGENTGNLGAMAKSAAMYQYASSGPDVTVEDAFSFAQHMSSEGKKLLAKAQAPGGSIDPDALKTLSLIDAAISKTATAEVTEFARVRSASMASAAGRYVPPPRQRSRTTVHRKHVQNKVPFVTDLQPGAPGPRYQVMRVIVCISCTTLPCWLFVTTVFSIWVTDL
eukprot:m.951220 g.951220  ORF g.951220 m.951220 type:complete len:498 (+) comp23865_c0_seq2:82-1575(+)